MKTLLEIVSVILFCLFTASAVFVFQGEPDLWDKWHTEAMK